MKIHHKTCIPHPILPELFGTNAYRERYLHPHIQRAPLSPTTFIDSAEHCLTSSSIMFSNASGHLTDLSMTSQFIVCQVNLVLTMHYPRPTAVVFILHVVSVDSMHDTLQVYFTESNVAKFLPNQWCDVNQSQMLPGRDSLWHMDACILWGFAIMECFYKFLNSIGLWQDSIVHF